MVTGLLHAVALSAIDTSLNQVLSLDNTARTKLEPLSGKSVQVHCELPDVIINITVCDDRLLLSGNRDINTDTVIRGKASALLKLLVKKNTASLKEDGVIITGNVGFLTSLQNILQNLDLDWEYQLSKIIGDIPTQTFADSINKAGSFVKKSQENLHQDIDDYLHQEKKLFPAHEELHSFYQSIDRLRLRIDRLNSRVSRSESRLTP